MGRGKTAAIARTFHVPTRHPKLVTRKALTYPHAWNPKWGFQRGSPPFGRRRLFAFLPLAAGGYFIRLSAFGRRRLFRRALREHLGDALAQGVGKSDAGILAVKCRIHLPGVDQQVAEDIEQFQNF